MLFPLPHTGTIQEVIDKHAVKEIVEYERFCRDQHLWEQMYDCYANDSSVNVSWYHGSGHGFVKASSKMDVSAPHKLHNTMVWLYENKAIAITMASIQIRKQIENHTMDLTSYVRLLYKIKKAGGDWKIQSMDCIYEKDSLVPAIPEFLSESNNSAYRASYHNLASILGQEGYQINSNLPGDDILESVDLLYANVEQWLTE
ncbi:SnoaL-like protein [Hungatella effluvii]|uniref:SnoaL-like protein n=1 Tax=Hungatella effluvii TaxID=1096246 RepID=A0A2V3XYD9_9FIRM|nr:nuclear transport factor 2 family protein [Hungatella effluvii]PXX46383.1 SnoaL-like protein [Hungatella effluvii]